MRASITIADDGVTFKNSKNLSRSPRLPDA